MRGVAFKWRCDKCGEEGSSENQRLLDDLERKHKCDPLLYNMVRNIKTEHRNDGKIINNNGTVGDVAAYLGISLDLAHAMLDEMEERELAGMAAPYRM